MFDNLWPMKPYTVGSLYLDPLNPRLPNPSENLSQREIIADLIEHDDIMSLVKSMAESGYVQGNAFVITMENNKKIVLEGNRRIAAIKLLRKPEMAPAKNLASCRKYAKLAALKKDPKVPVFVAPSREDALRFLYERHTGRDLRSWSPANQARFIASEKLEDETVAEFSHRTGISKDDARKYLYVKTVYDLVLQLDIEENIRSKLLSGKFPLTTLMRIFDSSEARKWLGVEKTEDQDLSFKVPFDSLEKALIRVVSDLGRDDTELDSRALNTSAGINKYLSSLSDLKPQGGPGRRTTAKKISKKISPKKKTAEKNATRNSRRPTHLIPASIPCKYDHGRIPAIYTELRILKVDKTPNATGILFRTLLDVALTRYLEENQMLKPCVEEIRKRRKGNIRRTYQPTLREMLKYFVKHDKSLNGSALKEVEKLTDDKSSSLSLDTLNDIVHNTYAPPKADDLRHIVMSLEPFIKLILTPVPEKP